MRTRWEQPGVSYRKGSLFALGRSLLPRSLRICVIPDPALKYFGSHGLPGPRPRRGFSLFHALAAISVSSVLMGIAAFWIHQALHFSSSIRDRQRHHSGLVRLAQQLRFDVRSSNSLVLAGTSELLLRTTGGSEIRYVLSPGIIAVEKKRASQVLQREQFALAPDAIARWESEELPDSVTLVVERPIHKVEAGNAAKETAASFSPAPRIDLHVRVEPNRWPAPSGD